MADLGTSYRDGDWESSYRARWASVTPPSERAALEGHQSWVNGVCPVTVAGQALVASASADRTVRIWDPATGQQQRTLEGHHTEVNGVCPVTVGGFSMPCEQGQLPGRRYPDNAHGFTSSGSFAAIRNEVNLLPFAGPRGQDRRNRQQPRSWPAAPQPRRAPPR